MAKAKDNKNLLILIIIILVVGLMVVLLALRQRTENRQQASSYNDLNSAQDITQTMNQDGTMGPADYTGNFSNSLTDAYLGTLNFQVTDPPPNDKGPDDNSGKGNKPTHSLPTQAQGGNNSDQGGKPSISQGNNAGGPQAVTSLVLTITKVEVHLAYLGLPGTRNEKTLSPTPSSTSGKPSITPTGRTNQAVDHWETLNIGGTKTVDLVQLAKTNNVAALGLTKLANGRYTEIRLYVSSASATLQDGTKVTLTIPGRANIVKIVQTFVINSSKTTTLILDFDAQNSVIKAGDKYILKPVVAHLLENNE